MSNEIVFHHGTTMVRPAVREIEHIHSNWIEREVSGDEHGLMALCADDIELWPPNA